VSILSFAMKLSVLAFVLAGIVVEVGEWRERRRSIKQLLRGLRADTDANVMQGQRVGQPRSATLKGDPDLESPRSVVRAADKPPARSTPPSASPRVEPTADPRSS
jgi:hypothetical protein